MKIRPVAPENADRFTIYVSVNTSEPETLPEHRRGKTDWMEQRDFESGIWTGLERQNVGHITIATLQCTALDSHNVYNNMTIDIDIDVAQAWRELSHE